MMLRYFKAIDREHQNLTVVYVVALSSIAVMALLFQLTKLSIHNNQMATVETIRSIERQHALIGRVHSRIIDAQISPDLSKVQRLMASLKKRSASVVEGHRHVVNSLNLGLCETVSCQNFKDLTAPLSELTNVSSEELQSGVLEVSLKKIDDYKNHLDKIAVALDAEIRSRTQTLIYLDFSFLVLLLAVLVVQAFYGFRPAVKKLHQALSVRSDFISRISHEIRNPMNSIMGMADILKSTELTSEQRQYVGNLQRSSHVLLEMLNNLVDFSSLETSTITLAPSKFNLYKLVDKVTDVISVQAHQKGVELFVDIDPKIPVILVADVMRLEQVLLNFLNNSMKFTDRGFIQLKIEAAGEIDTTGSMPIRFAVIDTGLGISSDKLEDIFENFVQEDSSIKRKYGGSGLGLSICKQIVGLMGAEIEVNSVKHQGSEFSFVAVFETSKERVKNVEFNSIFTDSKIVYASGLEDNEPVVSYINKISKNSVVISDLHQIQTSVDEENEETHLIIDDSLGVINMVNAMTIAKSKLNHSHIFALMRSNFSKENIDLIRKSGCSNFLIKPFRPWHMYSKDKDITDISDCFLEREGIDNLKFDIQKHDISILAVDDSNDNLFLLREILSPLTKQIDFANNGLEACNQLLTKKYDIVFMDIQMPVMDGYTAIRRIRARDKRLPVFAVTAHAGLVEEKKCIEAGFTGRITKPINRKKIYEQVGALLKFEIPVEPKVEESPEDRMLRKLMPGYFEARHEDLAIVKKAIEADDYDTIKRIGHRVKGSAKSYGFEEIGHLSDQLENAAIKKDHETCRNLIGTIDTKLSIAKNHFLHQPRI